MFTIKYRSYNPASSNTPVPEGHTMAWEEVEQLFGPFAYVEKAYSDGSPVVRGRYDDDGLPLTFGPALVDGRPTPRVFVMNEHGATVASYWL